jgi:chaperonin GroES
MEIITALDVKVGDRVIFGKWSGTEIKIESQEYLRNLEKKKEK